MIIAHIYPTPEIVKPICVMPRMKRLGSHPFSSIQAPIQVANPILDVISIYIPDTKNERIINTNARRLVVLGMQHPCLYHTFNILIPIISGEFYSHPWNWRWCSNNYNRLYHGAFLDNDLCYLSIINRISDCIRCRLRHGCHGLTVLYLCHFITFLS